MEKRTIFIGDVHGCYKELKLLIKKLEIKDQDEIYFVGDYINKGPKSFKVIKFLYKHRNQVRGVLGNHDYYFLERTKNKETLHKTEQKVYNKLLEHPKIFEYYKNLPLYIEKENFILVHAGIDSSKKLNEQEAKILTTVRELNGKAWYLDYKGQKKIIYGHWAIEGLKIRENTIGIDSGCCYGKYLTAYILETGEIIQQKALDVYEQIK